MPGQYVRSGLNKLISVVIPTYNRQCSTDEAVQSINSSNPGLVEIIVVDDCGDIPYTFIQSINRAKISVTVIRLSNNVGPGMARKAGIAAAQGGFIAFLDSDDTFDEGWIDNIVYIVQANIPIDLTRLVLVGRAVGTKRSSQLVFRLLLAAPENMKLFLVRLLLTFFNPIITPSIVISKQLCQFAESLRYCEDYYTNAAAIFTANNFIVTNFVAVYLGRHPGSFGGESSFRDRMFQGEMFVKMKMFYMPSISIVYKFFIPFGIIYQYVRVAFKSLFHL